MQLEDLIASSRNVLVSHKECELLSCRLSYPCGYPTTAKFGRSTTSLLLPKSTNSPQIVVPLDLWTKPAPPLAGVQEANKCPPQLVSPSGSAFRNQMLPAIHFTPQIHRAAVLCGKEAVEVAPHPRAVLLTAERG